jgi:uncharacterized membrane protein
MFLDEVRQINMRSFYLMVSATSLARALQLGISTGIRSMTPIAAVSLAASQGELDLPEMKIFSTFARSEVAKALLGCAAGEILLDKVAKLPKRTALPILLWRMAMGAAAAGIAAAGEGESVPLGTGLGAMGAAWSSLGATSARQILGQHGIPDPLVGIAEDAMAMTLTLAALPKLSLKVG